MGCSHCRSEGGFWNPGGFEPCAHCNPDAQSEKVPARRRRPRATPAQREAQPQRASKRATPTPPQAPVTRPARKGRATKAQSAVLETLRSIARHQKGLAGVRDTDIATTLAAPAMDIDDALRALERKGHVQRTGARGNRWRLA